ncbi:MAG: NAD(P)/FAD-dependent oxidoreductase [Betaproteobacteria bacterium]|nr:NAD(P)/FAD-dependent oxidoreductase [Betaproteobacteria bacterium]
MMCGIEAARRGRSVLLLDHSKNLAEKIRISGGGRCNFTNLNAKPENYLSRNPHFCRSALARYTPQHFIALLQKHNIGYHEKTLGQLFCDDGAEAIIGMLKSECDAAGVHWCMLCEVHKIHSPRRAEGSPHSGGVPTGLPLAGTREGPGERVRFHVSTSRGEFDATSLVIATGGLSIPRIGATPFGYHVAEQFGIPMTRLKPGLVPLSFAPEDWKPYAGLTGISLDAVVSYGKQLFRESILFTHRGLSGPAILQISSYWEPGQPLHINLLPDSGMAELFVQQRSSRMLLSNFLAQYLPKRFADVWCAQFADDKPLNQYADKELAVLAARLHDWQITPSGTLGYAKAEVTCGGVDTRALSSKTMECNDVPGLYFIGEVVDVTGQLGGYNLQWAWSSGYAAGHAV